MAKKFSRHEQFLRIFSLLEILSASNVPLSDDVLIATLRDRLGLSKLSSRTLRRDCEFLTSCGYPIDHVPLPRERKYGWKLCLDAPIMKKLLAEPLTLLELSAFQLARSHLRPYEGTPLWTGIEMLRSRFEKCVPAMLKKQVEEQLTAFRVEVDSSKRYAGRPRLVSSLASAVVACRLIDVEHRDEDGRATADDGFRPHLLLVEHQQIQLFGYSHDGVAKLLPIERIRTVRLQDGSFQANGNAELDLQRCRNELGGGR